MKATKCRGLYGLYGMSLIVMNCCLDSFERNANTFRNAFQVSLEISFNSLKLSYYLFKNISLKNLFPIRSEKNTENEKKYQSNAENSLIVSEHELSSCYHN